MGDRIALLKPGRLQQCDRPLVIYGLPANVFVGQFMGALPMNFCEGTVRADGPGMGFETKGWTLELGPKISRSLAGHAGRMLVMGIRPEEVSIDQDDEQDQVVQAQVERVDNLGGEKRAYLLVGGQTLLARLPAMASAQAAASVRVQLNPAALRFFDPADGKAIP